MLKKFFTSLLGSVKKTFDYNGRATRFEYWTYSVTAWILQFVLIFFLAMNFAIEEVLGYMLLFPYVLITIAMILAAISLTVRRLHDVGLSGFWLLYLSPFGLAVIYVAYLLGLDSSCDKVIERNLKIGSCWLGWILTILAWFCGGSTAIFLLVCLTKSQKGTNEYGPNPYEIEA